MNTAGTTNINDLLLEVEMMTEQDYIDEDNLIMEQYTNALTAMQNLSKIYRDIVVDRLVNNMKYDDIAEKHGITLQTVKNRIRRGKAIIAEQITA